MHLLDCQPRAGTGSRARSRRLRLALALICACTMGPVLAADPATADGWDLGGAIRGRYDLRFSDAASDGTRRTSEHLSFDTLLLTAAYRSDTWYGAAQYRFYGGSFLYDAGYRNYPGEISFPVYAYVGRHLGANDSISVGLQAVPFDDTFWGSAFLNSLGFVYGMEETYNLGAVYQHQGERLSSTFGVFPGTAPNAFGLSEDSARYSVNLVKADPSVRAGTRTSERNMVAGRLQYVLGEDGAPRYTFTGSSWYSTVHNARTGRDGERRALALSAKVEQGRWHGKLLAAWQDIDNGDPSAPDQISVGNYDAPFNIATRGTLGFAEVGRRIDTGRLPFNVDLYANYARFFKTAPGQRDTQRLNVGAFWSDTATGRIRVWSELLVGRNDPFVGAGQYSNGAAAGGDDRYKASLLMVFGYYF